MCPTLVSARLFFPSKSVYYGVFDVIERVIAIQTYHSTDLLGETINKKNIQENSNGKYMAVISYRSARTNVLKNKRELLAH